MRVVLDTNVLVSAALKQTSPPALALAFAEQHGTLLKSESTERQLWEVLGRPHLARLIAPEWLGRVRRLMKRAEMIAAAEQITACRDRSDDKFLELAVSERADAIVSGDADLLVLHPFRSIPILTPAAFLEWLARSA